MLTPKSSAPVSRQPSANSQVPLWKMASIPISGGLPEYDSISEVLYYLLPYQQQRAISEVYQELQRSCWARHRKYLRLAAMREVHNPLALSGFRNSSALRRGQESPLHIGEKSHVLRSKPIVHFTFYFHPQTSSSGKSQVKGYPK